MASSYEEWSVVFTSGTDYEADLVRDRLDDSGIPAVVLTQRDHAFNLNVGDLAEVYVLVPPGRAEEAVSLIRGEILTDEELEEAALNADPNAEDAHSPREEAQLDSGNEGIGFSAQDEDESET
jgi:hypothetical protein